MTDNIKEINKNYELPESLRMGSEHDERFNLPTPTTSPLIEGIIDSFNQELLEDWLDGDYHNGKLNIGFPDIQDVALLLSPRIKELLLSSLQKVEAEKDDEIKRIRLESYM